MESVTTLINTINDEISRSLHKTLQPFVLQIEGDRQNYNAVLNVMRGLPEYKELVAENIVLKIISGSGYILMLTFSWKTN